MGPLSTTLPYRRGHRPVNHSLEQQRRARARSGRPRAIVVMLAMAVAGLLVVGVIMAVVRTGASPAPDVRSGVHVSVDRR